MNVTDEQIDAALRVYCAADSMRQGMRAALSEFAAALAAQPAEPVAEVEYHDICADHTGQVLALDYLPQGTKLYAAPPPARVPPPTDADYRAAVEYFALYPSMALLAFNRRSAWAYRESEKPPARAPLPVAPTDAQIDALKWHLEAERSHEAYTGNEYLTVTGHREFARAVLAAAGVTVAEGGANG